MGPLVHRHYHGGHAVMPLLKLALSVKENKAEENDYVLYAKLQ
jgi:hypothetical protein